MSISSNPAHSKGRLYEEEEDKYRTCFQRDRDRIIHSGAFRKLEYKTQVFINHEGDYYRTRLTHTLEVAQITRAICKRLELNEDLGEAIALSHDLGHTPFGHAGEDALTEATPEHYRFDHNAQSLRVVTLLEQRYASFDGMNLSWEVLEGIAKHNGPIPVNRQHRILKKYNEVHNLQLSTFASLEAQVAGLSDDIAYNTHDIDDGVRSKIISLQELYSLPLIGEILYNIKLKHHNIEEPRLIHEALSQLVRTMINDVIKTTLNNLEDFHIQSLDDVRNITQPIVCFSPEISQTHASLKQFLTENLYQHYTVNRMKAKTKRIVHDLFKCFYGQPECLPEKWGKMFQQVLGDDDRISIICDFIAGMTDRYAIQEHKRLFDYDV